MGLSPSEKKEYNASKRRRRQALESYETGRIRPIRSRGKKVAAAAVIAVFLLGIAAAIAIFSGLSDRGKSSEAAAKTEKASNELLLQVVNSHNPLTANQIPQLTKCRGVQVNTLMADDLDRLIRAAKERNLTLTPEIGYISYDEQQELFDKQLEKVRKNGKYSQVKAEAIASRAVSKAGESEAQLGMLVSFDVSDPEVFAFLEREGIRYGFILRYPQGKEDLTHHDFSKAVFRYTGAENAQKMRTFNMCLEEFVDYLAQ